MIRSAGPKVVSIPVDEGGLSVERLEKVGGVDMVVLTPNRQHPTGATLAPDRRARLVTWAQATGTLVVEDDYDGEFRYEGRPIGALQSLDAAHVVYAGTVSKTLCSALRLGWLVAPGSVLADLGRGKRVTDWESGGLEQLTFAELLRSGDYDRHVRHMRLAYRRRRDLVMGLLRAARPEARVLGADAGLNLVLVLDGAGEEGRLLECAATLGLSLEGLTRGGYYVGTGMSGLIVGYGAATESTLGRALATLNRLVGAPG